jgi:hypothetical protein
MPDRAVAVVSLPAITRGLRVTAIFGMMFHCFSLSEIIFVRKSARDDLLFSRLNNM